MLRVTVAVLALVVGGWLVFALVHPVGDDDAPSPMLPSATLGVSEPPRIDASPREAVPIGSSSWRARDGAVASAGAERLARLGDPLEVRGRVLDANGMSLEGADVWALPPGTILEAAGYPTRTTIPAYGLGAPRPVIIDGVPLRDLPHRWTDADGAFAITVPDAVLAESDDPYPAPGVPQIIVWSEGHAVRIASVRAYGGVFDPRRGLWKPELRLRREGVIAGRVVDEAGRPLAGVAVNLAEFFPPAGDRYWARVSIAGLQSTVTDVDGRFRLPRLWPGTVVLDYRLPGFARETSPEIVVGEGETTDVGLVVMPRGGTIGGRVVDSAGRPISGAVVFATEHAVEYSGRGCEVSELGPSDDSMPYELEVEWWRDTRRAVSGADGRFSVDGVVVPTTTVYARADGFEAARRRDIATGSEGVGFALQPEAVLHVRVVEKVTGRPVKGASVSARRVVGEHHQATPLRVGRSRAGSVVHTVGPRGTRLEVGAPGFADATVTVDGQLPGTRVETTVALVREASISGRVVDRAGAPVASAWIQLQQPAETPEETDDPARLRRVAQTWSDADGSFRFDRLGPGHWVLRAAAESSAPGRPVDVTAENGEQLRDVELVLDPECVVRGTVHDLGSRAAAPRMRVSLRRDDEPQGPENPRSVWSDDEGRFRFQRLRAGPYVVELDGMTPRTITLDPGQTETIHFGASLPLVSARVTADGVPAAGFLVRVHDPSHRASRVSSKTTTAPDGRVDILVPGPGRFELSAFRSTGGGVTGPLGRSESFSIDWGDHVEVDVATGTGRIAGVVQLGGWPLAGEPLHIRRDGADFGSVVTDESGAFAIDLLPAGRYRLRSRGGCDHEAHEPLRSESVELVDGGDIDLSFEIDVEEAWDRP